MTPAFRALRRALFEKIAPLYYASDADSGRAFVLSPLPIARVVVNQHPRLRFNHRPMAKHR